MALTGWKYYREIQIDNTNGDADLIDYQVCVELNYNNFDFTKPNSDGSDIRFTNDDKATLLDYWIENYDAEHETATIWTKVPLIPKNSTKSIFIWYGNTSATSESDSTIMTTGFVDNADPFGDSSCIATYPFNGNANDLSGNYNGTWTGTEAYATGKFGQAASFDGSSYISGSDAGFPSGANPRTISFWVYIPSTPSDTMYIFAYGTSSAGERFGIKIDTSYNVGFDTSGSDINYSTNITTGEFYHIVGIFDGTTLNDTILYVNNVLYSTVSTSTSPTNTVNTVLNSFMFGQNLNNSLYYTGLIDQVRIFNRALTADEVSVLYHNDIYTVGAEAISGSKLSGVVCDKNGNPITGSTVKVFVFDKDSGDLYATATSDSTDGTWGNNQIAALPNTKVLTVFALEGDYNGDTDIAGAEFDITADPDS